MVQSAERKSNRWLMWNVMQATSVTETSITTKCTCCTGSMSALLSDIHALEVTRARARVCVCVCLQYFHYLWKAVLQNVIHSLPLCSSTIFFSFVCGFCRGPETWQATLLHFKSMKNYAFIQDTSDAHITAIKGLLKTVISSSSPYVLYYGSHKS
jgi:hypothetical protein